MKYFLILMMGFCSIAYAGSWPQEKTEAHFQERMVELSQSLPVELSVSLFETGATDVNPFFKGSPEFRITLKNERTQQVIYRSKVLSLAELKKFKYSLTSLKDPIHVQIAEVNTSVSWLDRSLVSYSTRSIITEQWLDLAIRGKNALKVKLSGALSTKATLQFALKDSEQSYLSRGAKVMRLLAAQFPKIKTLLAKSAAVREGYTIREHNMRVLETYNRIMNTCPKFYSQQAFGLASILKESRADQMQLTLVLHDIGKPLAAEAGNSRRQHEFTAPLIQETYNKLNLPATDAALALALMDNDILGDLLQGFISVDEAMVLLKQQALRANVHLKAFFLAQVIYYTADAGSYPYLAEVVFEDVGQGCFVPRLDKYNSTFWKLWKLIFVSTP